MPIKAIKKKQPENCKGYQAAKNPTSKGEKYIFRRALPAIKSLLLSNCR